MASEDKVLYAVSCTEKTFNDIHVKPYGNVLEDTCDVSTAMHCAKNGDMEDSLVHEKRIEVMGEVSTNEKQEERQTHTKRKIITPEMIRRMKIFVGGLPSGISEEEFRKYFERFGTITDVVVMQDSVTHRPRGFGFITFDSEKSVEDVMMNRFYDLNGKQVEVKRVVPKEENGAPNKLRSNNGKGTSWENFPYYNTNIIQTHPWYNNNGLYVPVPNYGWYPMPGASLSWCMPMVPMTHSCPQPFGYSFPSYPCFGGNHMPARNK
ncbi:hypothetical protein VNO78_28932 [Psophocarpus tetragonolobus]|uniref:RRM domain-containing protein n=1 Tax=Psophocarpus tetragonolobus TaxID=3891 RepID=A0AAN9RU40_PSOTE